MEYLLAYYYEVAGADALTYAEIQAYSQITQKDIRPWEAEALVAIDRVKLKLQNEAEREALKN